VSAGEGSDGDLRVDIGGSIARSPYTADYFFLTAEDERSSTIKATAKPVAVPQGGYYN